MNVLVINTYGGSLLLGAKVAKANVIATMEDSGFGSDLQALNFPKLPRYEKRADWPEKFGMMKWRDIDVVAHPPCAAFSVQNNSVARRGINTDAFHCHQDVIDYALSHKCRTLTIESVIGAYEGAHDIYEENAAKYGYRINYVMINSASCGVPQWRDRVWVVYHQLPKRQAFRIDMHPKYVTLATILDKSGTECGPVETGVRKTWERIRGSIRKDWPTGPLPGVLEKVYDIPHEPNFGGARAKFNIRSLVTNNVRLISEEEMSPVIMHATTLAHGKRLLTVEEYCAIMGFPRDYKFGTRLRTFRMYLSKGVCPPVAAWIMKTVDKNASGWTGPFTHEESDFGGVIDLRPKKQEALALANGRPWPPEGKIAVPRVPRKPGEPVVRARRDPSLPRGHRYRLVDVTKCTTGSPHWAFMLAALKKAGARGLTRGELVALAVKDPKGFPTNQPHDHAIGFFLSKFKSVGGLEFAE